MEDLVIEDVTDVEAKVGGSFRGTLSMNNSKCLPGAGSAKWCGVP